MADQDPFACTEVTPDCPVEDTIYGFRPNLGGNLFFVVLFGLLAIVNLVLGIRFRSWTYLIAMVLGAAVESLGHVGRVLLNDNPYSEIGFQIQICCLIFAPAFIAAGIYLILKHIVLCFGQEYSFLKARYYTWLFIFCDLLSLAMQGLGGGLAATASDGSDMLFTGSDIMMAGICFQVVTMTTFGLFAAIYLVRLLRSRKPLSSTAQMVWRSVKFRLFLGGFVLAYLTTLIRCIYRIAEMEGGWGSELMQSEVEFVVLDST